MQGVRVEVDLGPERMNAKIRKAQLMKVPYMAVLGRREVEEGNVALRKRDGSQETLSQEAFFALLQEKISTRSGEL